MMLDSSNERVFFRSNLLINHKTVSIRINNHKMNHIRNKRSIFNNMFQNLKNHVSEKDKAFRKEDNIDFHHDKENYGIVIRAHNILTEDSNHEVKNMHEARISSLHSRSFMIRSQVKKPAGSSTEIKSSDHNKLTMDILINAKFYNLEELRSISVEAQYLQRTEYRQFPRATWAVFIPLALLKNYKTGLSKFLYSTLVEGVDFYILIKQKLGMEKMITEELMSHCHVLACDRQKQTNTVINLEYFAHLPKNIIVIEAENRNQAESWYPFLGQAASEVKLAFFKTRDFQKIKEIRILNSSTIKMSVEIKSTQAGQGQVLEQRSIKEIVKLEIESLNLKKCLKKRKIQLLKRCSGVEPASELNFCNLQEKLLSYVKIVREEKQKEENSPANVESSSKQPKKQQPKSAFQIINELIRNNQNINKQIQGYVSKTEGIDPSTFQVANVTCDNIMYYRFS